MTHEYKIIQGFPEKLLIAKKDETRYESTKDPADGEMVAIYKLEKVKKAIKTVDGTILR